MYPPKQGRQISRLYYKINEMHLGRWFSMTQCGNQALFMTTLDCFLDFLCPVGFSRPESARNGVHFLLRGSLTLGIEHRSPHIVSADSLCDWTTRVGSIFCYAIQYAYKVICMILIMLPYRNGVSWYIFLMHCQLLLL